MDFPIKNGGSFHCYVKLPEGKFHSYWTFLWLRLWAWQWHRVVLGAHGGLVCLPLWKTCSFFAPQLVKSSKKVMGSDGVEDHILWYMLISIVWVDIFLIFRSCSKVTYEMFMFTHIIFRSHGCVWECHIHPKWIYMAMLIGRMIMN